MEEETAITLTSANFDSEVLQFPGVVLVDFWATWCPPCRIMAPHVENLVEKYKGNQKVKIGKLDVDENNDISERYRVLSIPTFKVFVAGEPLDQRIGAVAPSELDSMIEQALAKPSSAAAA
ncbi:thioredoxin [Patescibacteria group bacterium]|nr:thioredoxin [Patescibacteria group bacterium]